MVARSLPEAGLMDYDARFYLPALGRFTQPDTLVPGAGNPQNLNRYAYVRNNPLRYADPTGHWIDEGGGFATNKKKNGRLKIVSGRRVGNSDGDGVFNPPSPMAGSSGNVGDTGNSGYSGNAPSAGAACQGQYQSIICLPTPTHQPTLPISPLQITSPAPQIAVPYGRYSDPNYWHNYAEGLDVFLLSVDLVSTIQDGADFVKPGYRQFKSILPLTPLEMAGGAAIQTAQDVGKNLTFSQRFVRSTLVGLEAGATDLFAGGFGVAGFDVGGPVGYAAAAYAASVTADNVWDQVNANIFPRISLGDYP